MTTIATDGHTIAADRLVTGGGLVHGTVRKLHRAQDGSVIGVAGTTFIIDAFVRWYNDRDRPEQFDAKTDNFEALILKPDGTVWCYDQHGNCYEAGAPSAIGSGSGVAYGAMAAGATPAEAVRIACDRDTCSGGGVDWMTPGAG